MNRNPHRTRRTRTRARTSTVALAAAVGIAGTLAVADGDVHAATVVHVTNHADDGSPTSLRGVIDTANSLGGGWTFELDPGVPYIVNRKCQHGNPDDNHGGDLDIVTEGTVQFRSTGAERATITVVCAGERAIDGHGGGTLGLDGVRITGGNTAPGALGDQGGDLDGGHAGDGGAIRSTGLVVIVDSELDHNRTGAGGSGAPNLVPGPGGDGGRGGSGGAVSTTGSIYVEDSSIHHNTTGAGGRGGNGVGAGNPGGRGGAGGESTLRADDIVIVGSEVTDNVLGAGGRGGDGLGAVAGGGRGGMGGRGGAAYASELEVRQSTIARNHSGDGGAGGSGNGTDGGIGGSGASAGGLKSSLATIVNSTIHGNTAGARGAGGNGAADGGDGNGGGVYFDGTTVIVYSTITANASPGTANVYAPDASDVRATVIGEAVGGDNCSGPFVLSDYSVVDDTTCGADAGDIEAVLGLGPLTDNGGGTDTRMPSLDSPLFARIPDDVCPHYPGIDTDARGEWRNNWRCEPGAVELGLPMQSKFVPLAPTRLFDTREPGVLSGYVGAGQTRTVTFAGQAGIPATGVAAVAFNLTVTQAGGPGYVTASPHGTARPHTSNVNTIRVGQTVPNLVVVPLGDAGKVDFYAHSGAHLIADVVGYFATAQVSADGRLMMVEPSRVFDTREPGPISGKLAAGETLTIDVTGQAGVPGDGVAAVIVNVTATEAEAAGYVTAFEGHGERPTASTLNLERVGATTSNLAIVPVAPDGTISFFTLRGTHLLADVMAYVADDTAPVATRGLFVPDGPSRVFDTRDEQGPPLAPGTEFIRQMDHGPILDGGMWVNITATQATGPGYVTGWSPGHPRPVASNLNLLEVGETRANAALLPMVLGATDFFTLSGAHVVVDAFGFVVSSPAG